MEEVSAIGSSLSGVSVEGEEGVEFGDVFGEEYGVLGGDVFCEDGFELFFLDFLFAHMIRLIKGMLINKKLS